MEWEKKKNLDFKLLELQLVYTPLMNIYTKNQIFM